LYSPKRYNATACVFKKREAVDRKEQEKSEIMMMYTKKTEEAKKKGT
jgi:hypothetical protein